MTVQLLNNRLNYLNKLEICQKTLLFLQATDQNLAALKSWSWKPTWNNRTLAEKEIINTVGLEDQIQMTKNVTGKNDQGKMNLNFLKPFHF